MRTKKLLGEISPLRCAPVEMTTTGYNDAMALTHIDEATGDARMVDVGAKDVTRREAKARAIVRMNPETLAAIKANTLKKGDALLVARVAGIMAAKRTAELIPLCHTLPLSQLGVEFEFDEEQSIILITTSAATMAQTGVEMEALTAATAAALTIYDMAKSSDRAMVIEGVRLVEKTGGKSGDYRWRE